MGSYWMAQAAGRVMPAGSAVVNLSSVMAVTTAKMPATAYSAAKAGVLGMTRDLAAQWGEKGIRVNAILPGVFLTEATANYSPHYQTKVIKARVPGGRLGDPVERPIVDLAPRRPRLEATDGAPRRIELPVEADRPAARGEAPMVLLNPGDVVGHPRQPGHLASVHRHVRIAVRTVELQRLMEGDVECPGPFRQKDHALPAGPQSADQPVGHFPGDVVPVDDLLVAAVQGGCIAAADQFVPTLVSAVDTGAARRDTAAPT
jgi:3D (Asp-Asp-Asp) domain-containing protein